MNDAAVAQLKMKKIEKKTVSVTEPNKERMIARLLGCTAISEKKKSQQTRATYDISRANKTAKRLRIYAIIILAGRYCHLPKWRI